MWSTVWPKSQLTERMRNWLHLHLLYVHFSSSLPLSFDLKGNKIKKKYNRANCFPGKSFYCDKTPIVPYLILFLISVIFIENMLHVGAAAATEKNILLLHMWKIKGRERLLTQWLHGLITFVGPRSHNRMTRTYITATIWLHDFYWKECCELNNNLKRKNMYLSNAKSSLC